MDQHPKVILELLDRIQCEAVRVITGNLDCTPRYTLEPELNILPHRHQRNYGGLKYIGRICRLQNHPTKNDYENFYHYQFYDERNKRVLFHYQ